MDSDQVAQVERSLGVTLPADYRALLCSHGFEGDWSDHPEFITDLDALLTENRHFTLQPDDISDARKPGLIGALKFWLLYGSGRRLTESRRKQHKQWVMGKRFVIGLDFSEERYYILLDERPHKVYVHALGTQRSRVVAESISSWLAEVKRRQEEERVA